MRFVLIVVCFVAIALGSASAYLAHTNYQRSQLLEQLLVKAGQDRDALAVLHLEPAAEELTAMHISKAGAWFAENGLDIGGTSGLSDVERAQPQAASRGRCLFHDCTLLVRR